jgi:hypothetical protein
MIADAFVNMWWSCTISVRGLPPGCEPFDIEPEMYGQRSNELGPASPGAAGAEGPSPARPLKVAYQSLT